MVSLSCLGDLLGSPGGVLVNCLVVVVVVVVVLVGLAVVVIMVVLLLDLCLGIYPGLVKAMVDPLNPLQRGGGGLQLDAAVTRCGTVLLDTCLSCSPSGEAETCQDDNIFLHFQGENLAPDGMQALPGQSLWFPHTAQSRTRSGESGCICPQVPTERCFVIIAGWSSSLKASQTVEREVDHASRVFVAGYHKYYAIRRA